MAYYSFQGIVVKLYLAGGSAAAGERATIGLEIWLFRTGIGTFTPAKSIETVSDWLIYSRYRSVSRYFSIVVLLYRILFTLYSVD